LKAGGYFLMRGIGTILLTDSVTSPSPQWFPLRLDVPLLSVSLSVKPGEKIGVAEKLELFEREGDKGHILNIKYWPVNLPLVNRFYLFKIKSY
jgi:hypothetical protein